MTSCLSSRDRKTTLVVGYTKMLLDLLDELVDQDSVVVLEEPEIIERRQLTAAHEVHRCLTAVIPARHQCGAWPPIESTPNRPDNLGAVLPASEYGVTGAAALADLWGQAGVGRRAAYILRDKAALRARLDGFLDQPQWLCPTSEAELEEFANRFGGSVVLKPSNGQCSSGVLRCDSVADVRSFSRHFNDFTGDLLRASSIVAPRLLAEQRLVGPEFSVESLVVDGEAIFTNITAKAVAEGTHPVELGHAVPAQISEALTQNLATQVSRLVQLVGIGTAVLHSEWIVHGGVPHLIECAGRLPGDDITTLIREAWGFDFVGAWLAIMSGRQPVCPTHPPQAAAIWFLSTESGLVSRVDGVAAASKSPGVFQIEVTVEPGNMTGPLISSWSRVGSVLARGNSADQAVRRAREAADKVKVILT